MVGRHRTLILLVAFVIVVLLKSSISVTPYIPFSFAHNQDYSMAHRAEQHRRQEKYLSLARGAGGVEKCG
jgi:hypothetical protein